VSGFKYSRAFALNASGRLHKTPGIIKDCITFLSLKNWNLGPYGKISTSESTKQNMHSCKQVNVKGLSKYCRHILLTIRRDVDINKYVEIRSASPHLFHIF
jgi:hypothetical protein